MRTTLPNGLDVIVERHPTVPLVELRLWIPFAWTPPAPAVLLSETVLGGTAHRTAAELTEAIAATGGALSASVDADRLLIAGTAHADELDALLALVAETVTSASYPTDVVARQRNMSAHNAMVVKSLPAMRAFEALNDRLYGSHPYGLPSPTAEEIAAVTADDLRTLHAERVRPHGATLVLVGDVDAGATDRAERALAGWTGTGGPATLHPVPEITPGPIERVHDPLAAQAMLRVVLPSVRRDHPDYAAVALANLVLGGYFSSRLVANLREDKGLSYAPKSEHVHVRATSLLLVSVDSAHGEAALTEVLAELDRLSSLTHDEVEHARRHVLGSMRVRAATQPGVTNTLLDLVTQQLDLDLPGRLLDRFASVTLDDVAQAAARHLAPAQAAGVLLTHIP
jgi:zinc protease